jgi:outer membrane protein assembly factor BamA
VLILAHLAASAILVQDAPASRDTVVRSRLTVLPVVSYSEVTGVQYGATLFRRFQVGRDSATRPSSLSLYAATTAKDHVKAHAQVDRWSSRNSTRSRVRLEYISYPLPFYGTGPGASESNEEWYSSGVTTVQFFVQRAVRLPMYAHAGLRYVKSRVRETEAGGLLEQGLPAGSSGSDVVSAELGLLSDSRDNVGSPRTGTYARIIPSLASRAIGSDFVFRRLTFDARRYGIFAAHHVVAVQFQYDGISGATPFDQLPMIGADTAMRGYPRGRYRDQQAITTQVELRSAHWRRVGAVAFAGAGTVAPSLSDLASGAWYPSLGAGVRYVLSPKDRTVVRLDLGIGRGSFGINVGIGEAF